MCTYYQRRCLRNRTSSQDLDFFLHPSAFGQHYHNIRSELVRIFARVVERLGYVSDWANDEVSLFLAIVNNPTYLFQRSKEQNLVVFGDDNLRIYAVLFEGCLDEC